MDKPRYVVDEGTLTVFEDGETKVFEIDTSTKETTLAEINRLKQEGKI